LDIAGLEVKVSYSGEHDNPIAANIASCAQPQCGLGAESGRCEGDYHTQGKSLAGCSFGKTAARGKLQDFFTKALVVARDTHALWIDVSHGATHW